jgi:hypothetical protein
LNYLLFPEENPINRDEEERTVIHKKRKTMPHVISNVDLGMDYGGELNEEEFEMLTLSL